MAVRFLPPPGEDGSSAGGDRADLAEVIELRSLLSHAKWRVPGTDADPSEAGTDTGASEAGTDGARGTAAPGTAARSTAVHGNVVRGNFAGAAADTAPERDGASAVGTGLAGEARDAVSASDSEFDSGVGLDADAELDSDTDDTAPERSANEDGVRLLARKARSSGELRVDLLRLGHDPGEVETVIDEFERSLYLDDAGLARVLTEKLRDAKRASRSQIRTKLRARKLADAAIEAALGELDDDDEYALLRSTAADRARTLRDLDRQTAERRLLGYLARRGWSGEPATRVVREALDRAGSRTSGGGGVRFR